MVLTFKIFEPAKNHCEKLLKLCQTSFSGIINSALLSATKKPLYEKAAEISKFYGVMISEIFLFEAFHTYAQEFDKDYISNNKIRAI